MKDDERERRWRCERCYRNVDLSKWTSIRAHQAGWFQLKDGRWWCPEHVPSWVKRWRLRQLERRASLAPTDDRDAGGGK